jgi:hypothetical protein
LPKPDCLIAPNPTAYGPDIIIKKLSKAKKEAIATAALSAEDLLKILFSSTQT